MADIELRKDWEPVAFSEIENWHSTGTSVLTFYILRGSQGAVWG
jgi:hypothetical protein